MPRLVVAPEARQDLQEIRDGIAKDDPKAAHRFVTRLGDMARMLAGTPAIGRDRTELGSHLRSFVADRYLFFYRPLDRDHRPLKRGAGIEIVRIHHGAREIDAVFSEDKN